MNKQEAIKILKEFHDTSALFSVRTALETVFPELKEGEDEKIRKELIQYIKNWKANIQGKAYPYLWSSDEEECNKLLAWLEKQGEKKPVWNEKDDGYKLVALSAFLNYYDEENPLRKCLINWLKSLKQRMGG